MRPIIRIKPHLILKHEYILIRHPAIMMVEALKYIKGCIMSPILNTNKRLKIIIAVLATALVVGAGAFYSQMGSYAHMHRMHHGANGMNGQNHAAGEHDMVNMPGLKGENVTEQETEELAIMFREFEKIERSVTNLPNGIRTITFSADEDVMNVLASHAAGMINRMDEKDDPKVFIQSPTLDILFERSETITTQFNMTDEGIEVIQTSTDPEVVTALQTHAAEVTDLADRGMESVHEAMQKRASK